MQSWWYLGTQCYIPSFKVIGQLVLGKIFKGFYHIWAWWPYWSGDLEGLYKFLFPQPKEALKEIWLHLAQWGIGGVSFKDSSIF